MGFDPAREAPFYFTKSPTALFDSGGTLAYPPGTSNFHHEMELVVAIGAAGFRVDAKNAGRLVFGYACGLDMTRRDLQLEARDKGRPWCLGKDVEGSAVLSPIRRAAGSTPINQGRIWLTVNGAIRQNSDLGALIWSVPELISNLTQFYHLGPGDLIFTGTPDGVGAVVPGDEIAGGIEGVGEISLKIGPAE